MANNGTTTKKTSYQILDDETYSDWDEAMASDFCTDCMVGHEGRTCEEHAEAKAQFAEARIVRAQDRTEDPAPEYRQGNGQGGSRGQVGSEPSEKQVAFWTSLLTKLGITAEAIAILTKTLKDNGRWTKRMLSDLIDDAKADVLAAQQLAPQATAPAATNGKPNRYAANCIRCGGRVEAEAGLLAKTEAGKWAAEHIGECPAKSEAPAKAETPEGMHRLADGRIFKVQIAVHGSGNPYAKELINGSFEYAPGAIKLLSEATKMTLEQAKEYGALYGVCCVCARTLTDEGSIEAGIGPVCAKRFDS